MPKKNWLAEKVEQWPLDKLLNYANNARTHSDEQITQIASSIHEFGFINPIIAASDGVIIAGHGRLAAAQRLKLKTVPVIVADHLTELQRKALVIADNQIALNSGWNTDMLSLELESLKGSGFDLDILGFDEKALGDLLGEIQDMDEEEIASDADEKSSGVQSENLTFGKNQIGLTPEEMDRLEKLLARYITQNGLTFGFAGWLCDLAERK
jgi:ParB-like chromosome segregation protein Spo0J